MKQANDHIAAGTGSTQGQGAQAQGLSARGQGTQAQSAQETLKILLADDERELSAALVAILRHEGYSVISVFDGEQALYQLETHGYDIAILDIMMPRLDGLSVLRKIRAQGDDTPVLMLTAKAEIDDRVAGLDAGANDYLVKPFAARELLARVRSITRTSPGAVRHLCSFGDIELDKKNSCLMCNATSVSLTATELKLMVLLMEHGAGLTTTEQMRRDVWGLLTDTEQSVIWVNISNLRKRLRSLGSSVTIAAERGLGYRLKQSNFPQR